MQFNSISFLIFFPIVVALYFVMPAKIKNAWLLLASYFFYGCWNAKYCILLFFSTFITYIGAFIMERSADKKYLTLITGIAINLCILIFFKYTGYVWNIFTRVLQSIGVISDAPAVDILLPVGISFFTFQAMGYLIDVYRGDTPVEKNFIDYALFVSFFPQLVAGPIERSGRLLKQLHENHSFSYELARNGLLTFLWGLFLKIVIADRCAMCVDTVYLHYNEYSGIRLLTGVLLFMIQLYCDFMGYSTMARGAAMILGFDLMENFRQPLFGTSIKDFWRRWHISLSSWFRDYLYIPLGGSRCSTVKKYRNILITFGLSGLWHGAHAKFLVWGLMHGIFQVIEDLASPAVHRFTERFKIDTSSFSWVFLCRVKTALLFMLSLIVFRAESFPAIGYIFSHLLDFSSSGSFLSDGIMNMGLYMRDILILIPAVLILLIVSIVRERHGSMISWLQKQNIVFRYLCYWIIVVFVTFSLDVGGQEFIYFQF